MKREILEVYRRYIPGLTPTEDGYFGGKCPWCGGNKFEVGLCNLETGEPTNFLCIGCGQEGSPEKFVETMEELQAKVPTAEEEEPKTGTGQQEVSSDLRIPGGILEFLTLDLPTRELQILLYLQIRESGISAKEIGEELQISQSNVYRYLTGLEKKRLIYSEGKPKCYFKIEDARLMAKFKR